MIPATRLVAACIVAARAAVTITVFGTAFRAAFGAARFAVATGFVLTRRAFLADTLFTHRGGGGFGEGGDGFGARAGLAVPATATTPAAARFALGTL